MSFIPDFCCLYLIILYHIILYYVIFYFIILYIYYIYIYYIIYFYLHNAPHSIHSSMVSQGKVKKLFCSIDGSGVLDNGAASSAGVESLDGQ